MGKKSREKKKRRQEKEEKVEEPKKGLLNKIKKSKSPKNKKSAQINKKKMLGGILTLIMLAILISVGFLLFQKAFRATPVAKYLPEDQTVATLEINIDKNHHQFNRAQTLLEGHPKYSMEELSKTVEEKFKVISTDELTPWIGREVGIAVLNSSGAEGKTEKVYFAEVLNEANAQTFLKTKASSTNREGYDLYISPSNQSFVIIGDYLFLSETPTILEELIKFQNNSAPSLYSSKSYRRTEDNMPLSRLAFLYINFKQVTDSFFQLFPFLSEKGINTEKFGSLITLFDAEGMALITLEDKFAVQSFLSIDPDKLENTEYIDFREKYTASLTRFVPADTHFFWGGENAETHIMRILEVLTVGEKTALNSAENYLQNLTEKYLGPEVNFNEDLIPLLENEFAFALKKEDEKNIYTFIIELSNPEEDLVKVHEIADNFAEVGAIFEPKVVEHTLEDGTKSKEIIAVPEKITRQQSNYEGLIVHELQMGERDWGIFYTFVDDIVVISTKLESLKEAIDASILKIPNLKSSDNFDEMIKPILSSSDEVLFMDVAAMFPEFEPISSLSSGKNYFNDGIVSINYLQIL